VTSGQLRHNLPVGELAVACVAAVAMPTAPAYAGPTSGRIVQTGGCSRHPRERDM